MPNPLPLDIVSDTICPWCYVGKRRLEAALPVLAAEGLTFDITWRPFQLNPDMPDGGVDRRTYRTIKFGSWERSLALDAQIAAAGTSVGLSFRHDLMQRTPNTVASHALVRLAHELGGADLQGRVVEALFVAYFTQGADVGDLTVLTGIARSAGIDDAKAGDTMRDPAVLASVVAEDEQARRRGFDGVPSFVLSGHFLFSGAQSSEMMAQALRSASAQLAEPARARA